MFRIALISMALLAVAASAGEEWFREIDIRSEPAPRGHQDYSVTFTPARTHTCSKVVFECIYRQVFTRTRADGKKAEKIHEPARFKYERTDVKAVDDLDLQISFRVPASMERLEAIYGPKAFNRSCPVSIDRLRITGESPTNTMWCFELKPGKTYDKAALAKVLKAMQANGEELEDVDGLDFDVLRKNAFK